MKNPVIFLIIIIGLFITGCTSTDNISKIDDNITPEKEYPWSQVNLVLIRHGYNPNNVDYAKVNDETANVPPKIGSIETTDVIINTKYEAAIALEWKDSQWVSSILLLNEMQRTSPDRAEEFQKNVDSIMKIKNVSTPDIEDAYKKRLMVLCKDNKYLTYYVKDTNQISPEITLIFQYLTCKPSERSKYEDKVVQLAEKLLCKAKVSVVLKKGENDPDLVRFTDFMASIYKNHPDIKAFVFEKVIIPSGEASFKALASDK